MSTWSNRIAHPVHAFWPLAVRHLKRYGFTWCVVFALFGVIQANYRLAINRTPSLPYTLFLICLNDRPATGGYLAFSWHHGRPYPDGITFIKRLLASPGDSVERHDRDFMVGHHLLIGKPMGMTGRKLYPNDQLQEGKNTLPPHRYFVAGDHEYSLDSRYSLQGLVNETEVIGRAYAIF